MLSVKCLIIAPCQLTPVRSSKKNYKFLSEQAERDLSMRSIFFVLPRCEVRDGEPEAQEAVS